MTTSLLLVLLLSGAAAEDGGRDPLVNDARLNDVCFIGAQHGWAVGDRGAIWRTDDGGQRWRLQTSGVSCTLEAVHFRNERLGWAAGGFSHPYTHGSSGVLLCTRDGGQTWTPASKLALPALRRIGFLDDQHGWAIGCPSAMYPSGVFVTDDGGRNWRPLPGGDAAGWMAGSFTDRKTGALAGRSGALAVVRNGEIEPSRTESPGLQSLTQLRLVNATHGWATGDGGLVLLTADGGATWQPPPGDLPPFARQFDFQAMAARGPRCWLAGIPGTLVFHTADAGRTWSAFPTGSPTPLRAMTFIDDAIGWAVGDLGTILATRDGGRTWQRQRAGGSRAALLGVFGEADDVPLELLARLGADEGYLAAVEVVGRRDIEVRPRGYVHLAQRLHEAVIGAGGCSADADWRFPLRQAGLRWNEQQIVTAWDRVNDGRGIEALQTHLVRQICTWRPDVIVTNDAGRPGDDPLGTLVNQAVVRAVQQAADAGKFPQPLAAAGLAPWQVKKVYATLPPCTRGAIELITAQLMPRLGRSLAEAADEPRGLLQDHLLPAPPTLSFRLLASDIPPEQAPREFFAGIRLPPGGEARREALQTAPQGLDSLQQIARKRRHALAILDQSQRAGWSAEQLLAHANDLTRDLDDQSAGRILYQLADRYYRSGNWPLAAETFQLLLDRFPSHPLAPQARQWLLQYNASAEAAWRVDRDPMRHAERFERAVALGKELERTQPEQFAEPAIRFPLAAACRSLGQTKQAERYYALQSRGPDRDAWWACAQGELRLAEAKNRPSKVALACVRAEAKPHLDGKLNDPVWQKAKSALLQSSQHDDGEWPAAVMLAYDAEFLYIAAHCRQASSAPAAAPPAGPRPRDADLTAHDRVEVFLDVDRDFATYYTLAIDHRGWTSESCWGDTTWNPTWYVAAGEADGAWTVEAAIPLEQLTARPPKPGDVWALGVQRVAPQVGFQSWTTPAAIDVRPEGFGYLVFE